MARKWRGANRKTYAQAAAGGGGGGGGDPGYGNISPPGRLPFQPSIEAITPTFWHPEHRLVDHKQREERGLADSKWGKAKRRAMCSSLELNKRVWAVSIGIGKPLCLFHHNGNHKGPKWLHGARCTRMNHTLFSFTNILTSAGFFVGFSTAASSSGNLSSTIHLAMPPFDHASSCPSWLPGLSICRAAA